jgi:hypothetical protein
MRHMLKAAGLAGEENRARSAGSFWACWPRSGRAVQRLTALGGRLALALVAAGALALGIANQASGVAAGSSSATCKDPTAQPPHQRSGSSHLAAVAATSGCKAWGVGYHQGGVPFDSTLIEYWNGAVWKRQPSPNLGTDYDFLNGVAATSPTNAWAVGCYDNGGADQPLIEHWDGSTWQVQPSTNPGGSTSTSCLTGVAATSSTNAWAVGFYDNGGLKSLILHWDGTGWTVQPSPNVGVGGNLNQLFGVAATSSSVAWAVGFYDDGVSLQTLIERWDGTTWKVLPSPNVGGSDNKNELLGVASTSKTNAWAVGKYRTRRGNHTLVERWNGTAWKVQPSPNAGRFNQLSGVAATSSTNAWAVGFYHHDGVPFHTLAEHWNGTAWKVKPSPNPGSEFNYLDGVAATSSTNAWAVGYFNNFKGLDRTLALHWNGTAWSP